MVLYIGYRYGVSDSLYSRTAREPFHFIQAKIILGDFESLIQELKASIETVFRGSGSYDATSLLVGRHLLRFMAHFVLFLKAVDYQFDDVTSADVVLSIYVQHLIDLNKVEMLRA